MLSTFTNKIYTGKGPFKGWNVLFRNGKPVFATQDCGGPAGLYPICNGLKKAEREELARKLLDTDIFQTTVKQEVENQLDKADDEDDDNDNDWL